MVGAIQEQQEEVNPKDFVTGSNLTGRSLMFTSENRINIANSLLNIIMWMIPGFLISLVQCMISG
jgi:hypothetical protein